MSRKKLYAAARRSLPILVICIATTVYAKTSDRQQKINVSSTNFSGLPKPNEKSVLNGKVDIRQGTLHATGQRAEIFTDANGDIDHVILTGDRAHVEQLDDQDVLVNADAKKIDYHMDTSIAELTGNATTSKQGAGNASADHMVYNMDTGDLHADSESGNVVHMTIIPKKKGAENDTPGETRASGSGH